MRVTHCGEGKRVKVKIGMCCNGKDSIRRVIRRYSTLWRERRVKVKIAVCCNEDGIRRVIRRYSTLWRGKEGLKRKLMWGGMVEKGL